MITLKSIEPGPTMPHWYIGAENMCRVSPKTARGLAGMYPMPRAGYEIVCAVMPGKGRLYLANISGSYWLKCGSWPIGYWPDVFGIEVHS